MLGVIIDEKNYYAGHGTGLHLSLVSPFDKPANSSSAVEIKKGSFFVVRDFVGHSRCRSQ